MPNDILGIYKEENKQLKTKLKKANAQIKGLKRQLESGKYPFVTHKWILSQVISWLEDKPDLAQDLINFVPQADKDILKDMLNLY